MLTASHCFPNGQKNDYILRFGDFNNVVKEEGEQEFDFDLLIKHEQYSGRPRYDFDVALVRLKPNNGKYLVYGDTIQPACLPEPGLDTDSLGKCYVSGWGRLANYRYPKKLQGADVPVIPRAECAGMYKAGAFTEQMVCAGFESGGIDTCQGDSGGPLVCDVNGNHTVIGATSWGNDCGRPNSPGVYARIQVLREWIEKKMRDN